MNVGTIQHEMKKKDNILKRYPIIPSVFFLLFAWMLLYVITAFKESGDKKDTQTRAIKNEHTCLAQGQDPAWKLQITDQGIFLELPDKHEILSYPYVEPSVSQNDNSEIISIYKSKGSKDEIVIMFFENTMAETCRAVVECRGKVYATKYK